MRIIDFCRNVNFSCNLFQLIIYTFALSLVTIIVLLIKKIVLTLQTERKIDQHLRETRARISRAVTEIEEYRDRISEAEAVAEAKVEIEFVKAKEITTTLNHTFDDLITEYVMGTLTQPPTKDTKQDTKQLIDNVNQNKIQESILEVSQLVPKGKKTRAMSMEERWAEFDKKRSMRNTA